MPVPSGIVASSAVAPRAHSPFTTSLSVPSPPTATTSVGAVACRALCELDQMTGALREERLAREPELRRRDARARASACPVDAVARRRVDEEDGAGR